MEEKENLSNTNYRVKFKKKSQEIKRREVKKWK